MYNKYSSKTFVNSLRIKNEIAKDDEEAHNVSPRRHTLRTQANANMQKKANSITAKITNLSSKSGTLCSFYLMLPIAPRWMEEI
jgi:hypothetical protein